MFFNVLFYLLLFPATYYFSRKPSRYKTLNGVRKIWANSLFFCSGIFYRIRYEMPLDKNQTYVICANHTSFIDIAATILFAKGTFHFMGKEELKHNPLLRIFFETIDITVNRDSKMSAFRSFKKASENVAAGRTLIIFPEGGIEDGNYPPQLLEFKSGAFKLAIKQQVPIVPVTFHNNWRILYDDGLKYGSRPGMLHITVHEPIPTIGLTSEDADKLRNEVFSIIEFGLK